MTIYSPPIESRSTEELLSMKYGSTDYWQQDAIDLAKAELNKRKISIAEEQKFVERKAKLIETGKIADQKRLDKNAIESYDKSLLILIFLISPFIFLGRNGYHELLRLKNGNYQIKYKQRLTALIGGIGLWILILLVIHFFY